MRSNLVRWVVGGVILVVAVITGVVLVTNRGADTSATDGDVVTRTVTVQPSDPSADTDAGTTPGSADQPTTSPASPDAPSTSSGRPIAPAGPDGRAVSNVPMTKLAPGEEPPQFIIFSFDGAGSTAKMDQFMDVADETDARFVAFLTGTYLLEDSAADAYHGPGSRPGRSDVGFGGDRAEVVDRVEHLNDLYLAGHEVGTHYNGHFCALGSNWSTAEWNSELDQFFTFLTDWKRINGAPDAPDLIVPADAITGGRTPCLEHRWDQIVPSWKGHGMTYDSSEPAPRNGVFWPQRVDGIWEFYMPYVYSPAFSGMVTAMDYNFWVKFNGGKEDPASAPELRRQVLDTYRFMYDQAFNGNRAPVLVANHFNDWNGNSFNPPAIDFMSEVCGEPETYCATYQDVIAWMELQDPAVLDGLLSRFPVAHQG